MFVVGITGGIGSGKTTVTNLFQQHGIVIVDADVIARHIMDKGGDALKAVKERYGQEALLQDGNLNRAWLRDRIFKHPEDKQWLNELTHPLIREQILSQLQQAQSPYVMLSAPLLVENRLTKLCDRVLVVDVSEATQLKRTQQRDDVSEDQVQSIINAQASREQRLQAADNIIRNEDDVSELAPQVEKLHELYLRLALTNQSTH